jgi:hypothetical protein
MKTLLSKNSKDLEELQQMVVNNLPSQEIKKEQIVRDAVKSTSLPSEVQKSMSELLAERLKAKPINDDVDDVVKKVQKDMRFVDTSTVNMGTTSVRDKDGKPGKGRMLG